LRLNGIKVPVSVSSNFIKHKKQNGNWRAGPNNFKIQNLKFKMFGIYDFGHCDLFGIWCFEFVI